VVSTNDPATNPDPNTWGVVPDLENLAATPPLNQHRVVRPAEPLRFYALVVGPVPPLFFDDFEAGPGNWTTAVNDAHGNSQWELGTPAGSTGPLAGAADSANAWSTNIGDYGADSDIALRSPAIDLGGAGGAELTFEAFRDADGLGDSAVVRFLRATDQIQLGAETPLGLNTLDEGYVTHRIAVAPEALGERVVLEFNFVSDGSADAFSGLSIDNVRVEVTN
jgi:hypothetical protein